MVKYQKVRVTFKTPVKYKTGTMLVTKDALKYYKSSKSSPFKKITRIR